MKDFKLPEVKDSLFDLVITERVYLLVQGDRFIDKRSFKLITFTEEEKQSPAVARSWQEFDNKISSVSSTKGGAANPNLLLISK